MDLSVITGSKIHALIIDDDDDIRESLVEILNEMNLFTTVVQASNGLDGIKRLLNQNFDVIITDLVMPKMSGIELIEKISKDNSKLIPNTILLSGNLTGIEVQRALKLGVKNVVVKPCTEEDFITKVKKVLTEHPTPKVKS